jgi:hypothetical protein
MEGTTLIVALSAAVAVVLVSVLLLRSRRKR